MEANRGGKDAPVLGPAAWFLFISGWSIDPTKQEPVSWVWDFSLRYIVWVALLCWIVPDPDVVLPLLSYITPIDRAFKWLAFLYDCSEQPGGAMGSVVAHHAMAGLSLS